MKDKRPEIDEAKYRYLDIGEAIGRYDVYYDREWMCHTREHIGMKVNQGHYPIRRELIHDDIKEGGK